MPALTHNSQNFASRGIAILDQSYEDQAKSERERQREERAGGGSGAAGKTQSTEDKIYNWLTNTFFKDFQERLPQHAMS